VTSPPEPRHTSLTLRLAALLSLVGGFLDAYTYLSRNGVFATAQTGNIILMIVAGARDQWGQAVQHLPPIAAFLLGVVASEALRLPAVVRLVRWPPRVAIGLEAAVLVVVGFLPPAVPDVVVTACIAFVAALQISWFRTVGRWAYTSTMTTGNLRSVARAGFHAVLDRDAEARLEALHLGGVVITFVGGAVLGCAMTLLLDDRAAWVAAGVLCVGVAFFVLDDRVRAAE
jgi:uncharacterized membrane protein YoaK (UPF0700 family)